MEERNEEKKLDDFQVITMDQQQAALSTYLKAEIDMQIATAKAYPRSIAQFRKKVESLATVSQQVAEECSYAISRDGKAITGPSVRLAEIVISSYGNVRSGARVIANDGRTITAQGICHDLETNSMVTVEVRRRITTKSGKTYSEDMQVVTGNAACAIALRNAIFKVVPSALISEVYDKIKEVAKGDAATLVARRDKALKYFKGLNVTEKEICDVLEIKEVTDIDLDKLQILTGLKNAITNNESSVEEIFKYSEHKTKSNKAADQTAEEMKDLTAKAKQQ